MIRLGFIESIREIITCTGVPLWMRGLISSRSEMVWPRNIKYAN